MAKHFAVVALLLGGCGYSAVDDPSRALAHLIADSVWQLKSDKLHLIKAIRVNDRHIVVSNAGVGQVLGISRRNDAVVNIGRVGQGPGEYRTLSDLALVEDTVFVLDAIARNVQRFVTGDSVAFISRLDFPDSLGTAERVFPMRDGSLVIVFSGGPPRPGTFPDLKIIRDSIIFRKMSHDTITAIASFPGTEYMTGFWEGLRWIAIPPFGTTTYLDLNEFGFTVGDGRSGKIELHAWEGRESQTLRLPGGDTLRTATEDHLKAYHARIAERAARMADSKQYIGMAEAGLLAWEGRPHLPYISGLVTDGKQVAMRRYRPPEDSIADWYLQNSTFGSTASFRLPSHLRIVALRADTLVVVSRDSLNVESIVFLKLRDSNGTRK